MPSSEAVRSTAPLPAFAVSTGTAGRPAPSRRMRPLDVRNACDAQRWTRLPPTARRVIALTALSLGLQAHALQLIEASDGVAVEAIVSIKEPTRIRIEGAAITDVVGNIHSSQCGGAAALPDAPAGGTTVPRTAATAINPAGEVVLECDRDKGEVYIRPVGTSDKPINLFVASATATYTLVLRRADVPADTIVLRDRTPRALRPATAPQPEAAPPGPAPSHIRAMKAMLVAMASDRVPADIRVEDVQRPIRLWAEAELFLLRLFDGRGWIGELYALRNVSAAPMVLAEPEFDRPDSASGGEVAGVAIERHTLQPGERTRVYVIRRGGAR